MIGQISSARSNPQIMALGTLLVFLIAFIGFGLYQNANFAAEDQKGLEKTAEMRTDAYRIGGLARIATEGDEASFGEMSSLITEMNRDWAELKQLSSTNNMMAADTVAQFDSAWATVGQAAQSVVDNQDTIIFIHNVANSLAASIPELQQEYQNIVEIMLEIGTSPDQVSLAQTQTWRAERIGRNVDKILLGRDDAADAADQFNYDASLFGQTLEGQLEGRASLGIARITDEDAVESLQMVQERFEFVSNSVEEIFQATPAVLGARVDTNKVLDGTPGLVESIEMLEQKIRMAPADRLFSRDFGAGLTLVSGAALAMVLVILLIVFFFYRTSQKRLVLEEATNERNEEAILRLLNEIGDLADGDLTATATVTEDFTGAIADSINFTIDQLRVLVSRINDTSRSVAEAATETKSTALHLAEASDHQAQEIAGASAAINEMAVTIDQVSSNAAESAAVAERSVSIAAKGAEVVQSTIQGMDGIREQIQETSKRIKRLGESSQEIGDIVSLINDIADQTNILALNAAIQASMAGDAGRGFAVVADEVQRLAERSSAATKQIEALVKTIQADTNEAVSSMESTTSEVVNGAQLAQNAGVALEEIESVSTSLADLIQNISNAARQQASSAGHISNTMNVIQEITSQTSTGTNATAQSIGQLTEMATELQDSVADFKLPDEVLLEETID